jgi:hypothetical protein
MNIPTEWILGAIVAMAGAMATVISTGWQFIKSRLEAQDRLLDSHRITISKLQDEVDRLSKGCGLGACLWKSR